MIRRYLAFRPGEIHRIYNRLDHAAEGMGYWSSGLPELHILACPIQHFQPAILDAWGTNLTNIFAQQKGFGEGLCWTFVPRCSRLSQIMLGNEIKD